jgi:DNA (cytosine-5)-methyltransferase 1
MKIAERGRAKFRPLKEYDEELVKDLLIDKIQQEQLNAQQLSEDYFEVLNRKTDKLNLVSLFSGCGGLDLGFELAGLDAILGIEKTNELLESRDSFMKNRDASIFHTISSIDMFKEANQSYRLNFPETVVQHEKDIRKIKGFPKL